MMEINRERKKNTESDEALNVEQQEVQYGRTEI